MRRKGLFAIVFGGLLLALTYCQTATNSQADVLQDRSNLPSEERYLNFHDSVDYVGMEACKSCHANVFETYQHTGMGLSFDYATPQKSAAVFDKHTLVYDSASNFYYRPFWRGDSLMVKEFRLLGTDTIHQHTEHIAYIIGSGHHTNSHLIDKNGYVYQAPITYYTQEGKWDMAPGFAGGFNSRFSRIINMECMTCHNAIPKFVSGSVNKFKEVPKGINCERCHGPGELHVKTKMAGQIVDTSVHPDFTIVNPSDLSVDRQMNICQRCHLQGVAVLNEDKFWDDYKPGMLLSDVMQVFLPEYKGKGAEEQFLMASHVERLKESACFALGELSCITCHNPHVSVRVSQTNHFNAACVNCHQPGNQDSCTENYDSRVLTNNNNCSGCHMPKSGAIDIPHVAITDHNIRIPDANEQYSAMKDGRKVREALTFIGLRCMTEDAPPPLTMAKGYLRFYEGFASQPAYLDSAFFYLQQAASLPLEERLAANVHYYYLKEDYKAIQRLSRQISATTVADANTAFRIGDALFTLGNLRAAAPFIKQAANLQPLDLNFLNKWGSVQLYTGAYAESQALFEQIYEEQPTFVPAISNLGTLYLNIGQAEKGIMLLEKAIALDPDYALPYLNLAAYHEQRFDKQSAKEILEQLLRHQPENIDALAALRSVIR